MVLSKSGWLNKEVISISFSAFFADLGYQAVMAGFPVFLVLVLKAPVWVFGLAMGIAYGPGALFGLIGGILGDKLDHKRVSTFGNSLIGFLSMSGIASVLWIAILFIVLGWWARNFRTPSRRVLLARAVSEDDRSKAFGFLHALDVGGGMLAGIYLVLLVAFGVSFSKIFLITLIPIAISTALLASVRVNGTAENSDYDSSHASVKSPNEWVPVRRTLFRAILVATLLYGFSSYSFGFPILTVSQKIHSSTAGLAAFIVFLGVSSVVGLLAGRYVPNNSVGLSLFGFLPAAVGSELIGISYVFGLGLWVYYLAVCFLGAGLGVIETIEPTLVAKYVPEAIAGKGMGYLTGSRSLGLFLGNILLGALYLAGPFIAYTYATASAVCAVFVLLSAWLYTASERTGTPV